MAFGTSQCQDGVEVLKCYEWRCQGTIKDAFENLKNTKKRIKKDSNRHFDKKLINLWTYVQIFFSKLFSAWSSQYDNQVKKKPRLWASFVTRDIDRQMLGKLIEFGQNVREISP